MSVASGTGSSGTVRVIGDGTSGSARIEVNRNKTPGLYLGVGGNATLDIRDGGVFDGVGSAIWLGSENYDGASGNSTTTIDGAGSILRSQQSSDTSLPVWERGGTIEIGGNSSANSVSITNGGLMEAVSARAGNTEDEGWLYLGADTKSGGSTTVTVSGAGSTLRADNHLGVGSRNNFASTQLNIANGATAEVVVGMGMWVIPGQSDISISSVTGDTSVNVNGSGSSLSAVNNIEIGGSVSIAGYTSGGVPIVNADWTSLDEGQQIRGEDGSLLYDRSGTPILAVMHPTWGVVVPATYTDGNRIYTKSEGSLTVENNATVTAASINISVNSPEALPYTGGDRTLTIRSGGTVYGDVNVNEDGVLNGDGGTIVGNVNVNGGIVAPGNSPGIMSIDGDLIVNSGSLEIELDSPTLFDQFFVTGDVFLGADAMIDLVFGYQPTELIDLQGLFNGYTDFIVDSGFDPLTDINPIFNGTTSYFIDVGFAGQTYTYTENGAYLNSSTVPEPAALLLLATGIVGIGFSKRRSKVN
jgi:T5SS/PEP-CTERM-associated repeat protein